MISWTIKNNKSDIEIGETIKDLVDFQFNLSAEGFFLRGGISISNNYIDDNIIFGNGIINSYKLESEIAKYPRIILDKYAKEAVNKSIQKTKEHTDKEFIFFAKFIAIDQVDKQYFINYLSYVLPTNHKEEAYYMLEKHKVMIENKLISSYGDCPNIFRKYKWLAQYHNSFCKKHFNNKPNLIINNLINNHNRFQELSEIL